jgi:GNAT superfamily N-acetyltransferase
MEYTLRDARASDKELLAPWTTHTFAWGDYVVDSFDRWLAHPQSRVLVAADDTDEPVAVARGVLLSPDELWLQGIRVHPEWRRRGIASELGESLQQWGARQNAKVALLMIEDWNEAARDQVTHLGFRETTTWLRAFQTTKHSGRLIDRTTRLGLSGEPLQRSGAAEVGPAYLAWSGGELSRASRGMMAVSWQCRRLHIEDLQRAAEHGALLAGPTGWAVGAPRDNRLEVGWTQTTPDRARAHFNALLDVAVSDEAATLEIMMPAVLWLEEAALATDFEIERLLLFEKSL